MENVANFAYGIVGIGLIIGALVLFVGLAGYGIDGWLKDRLEKASRLETVKADVFFNNNGVGFNNFNEQEVKWNGYIFSIKKQK